MALLPFIALAYLILYVLASRTPYPHPDQHPFLNDYHEETTPLGPQLSLDAWIAREEKIAFQKLLDNIAPFGDNAREAAPGTVIASPSRTYPDYYYQWIRDAAITLSTLTQIYARNTTSLLSTSTIFPIMEAYVSLSSRIQHTPNPSGSFADLSGLGEPKFQISGAPFLGSWGRPQMDGPPLRALTLMAYLRAYNASHPHLWITGDANRAQYQDLYDAKLPTHSVIKADLEYVARYWSHPGFDLWEEVSGTHFFTASVQLRALREGADIARAFGDAGAADWYEKQAALLSKSIQRDFWDEKRGHLVATKDTNRSGLDCALLLGAIHGDPEDTMGGYAPYSEEVLVSLLELVKDQRFRFPINAAPESPPGDRIADDLLAGVGIGRYPEDVYDGYGTSPSGGNPWFLCTASVAEVLFRTASHLAQTSNFTVSPRGAPFWQAIVPAADTSRSYYPGDGVFDNAITRLTGLGDQYFGVIRKHTDAEGALSEQFDRNTGYERGARDLTWSYGAFLQAVEARKTALGRT
jgi:glucoamylase